MVECQDNYFSNIEGIKVCLLGSEEVGKTSLVFRIYNNTFPSNYDKTIEDGYYIKFNIKGEESKICILDTGGADKCQFYLRTWIDSCNHFLLVFSIDNSDSFGRIKNLYEIIRETKRGKTIGVVILMNKCDLPESEGLRSAAEIYAKSQNLKLIECSSKKSKQIEIQNAFETVIDERISIPGYKKDFIDYFCCI